MHDCFRSSGMSIEVDKLGGNVFEIQHFSVDDGPGIRTVVFLKGCQMRCLWCHNPESLDFRKSEFSFVKEKCVQCGICFQVCPNGCHTVQDGVHQIDRDRCAFCGKCVSLCAGKALSICGRYIENASEILDEVERDRAFYTESGGGMTLSGGEPMMQPDFVSDLVRGAKARGINVAMETNGCYEYSRLDGIREFVDTFLVDWKVTDDALHRQYTGLSNQKVLQTIHRLHDDGYRVLVRCPIIPGYNDKESHFKRIAEMTVEMPGLIGAELMPYHSLGVGKIRRFGLENRLEYIVSTPPSKETIRSWIEICRSYGGRIINS